MSLDSTAPPVAASVAIVTGAGSGIGLGTALKLAEAGMCVLGVGRDPHKLAAMADRIGNPAQVETLALDITLNEAPARIMQAAEARWGRVDYLINNAGLGSPKPLHETDDDNLDHFLDVMLRAPFRLAREAVTRLQPGGAIINVSSIFAVVGGLRGGAYAAAKAGLDGLTRHIACQYGALGIRANSVAPGVTVTPMVEHRLDDPVFRRMNTEVTPHTRLGRVEDIASTIAFLCSPGGSFINGQVIVVDGGWSTTKYLSEFGRTSVWTAAAE